MQLILGDVLDSATLGRLSIDLARIPFTDGRVTAGWAARLVKQNEQAAPDPLAEHWCDVIRTALLRHEIFRSAALPKRVIGPMLTRYRSGDHYGLHVDDAVLDGSRADLSFTLFLDDAHAYDGGELIIDTPAGEEMHKLSAGQMLLYPANSLHRVAPVTRGTRHAAVGWVRSLVRQAEQRELIFDLERVRATLFARDGKSEAVDLLSKSTTNLVRMWCDD